MGFQQGRVCFAVHTTRAGLEFFPPGTNPGDPVATQAGGGTWRWRRAGSWLAGQPWSPREAKRRGQGSQGELWAEPRMTPPKSLRGREAWPEVVVFRRQDSGWPGGHKGGGASMGGALVEAGLDGARFSAAAAPPTP